MFLTAASTIKISIEERKEIIESKVNALNNRVLISKLSLLSNVMSSFLMFWCVDLVNLILINL